MHTLSTLSLDRAVKRLAKASKRKYTLRVGEKLAEIVDDNGIVLDSDMKSPNLVRRLNSLVMNVELQELVKRFAR